FEIKPWKKAEILWEKCVAEDPQATSAENQGETPHHVKRTGKIVSVKMTDYGVFAPTEKADVPYAFLIAADGQRAVENLLTHGIGVEKWVRDTELEAEQFTVRWEKMAERAFQGHHEMTLDGKWKSRKVTMPAGTFLVRMDQPLARLAFYLLDPRSDDGLFEWN